MDKLERTGKQQQHEERHEAHKSKKLKISKVSLWQGVSAILAILLVIAIFTHGFRPLSISSVASDINTLAQNEQETTIKAGLTSAYESMSELATEKKSQDTGDKTEGFAVIDLYVMSLCPYGVSAETGAIGALQTIGSKARLNLYFIARETDTGFDSLHGQPEVNEDLRQVCIIKYAGTKLNDYLTCLNKNYQSAATIWEGCADDAGINTQEIKACSEGAEGKSLLSANIKRAEVMGATASPTIYINSKQYKGARDATSFARELCTAISDASACKSLPACSKDSDCTADASKIGKCTSPGNADAKCQYTDDVPVKMTVLNDKNCDSCDPTRIVAVTKQYFPNLNVSYIDYNAQEGKDLAEELGISILPAYIFDSNVKNAARYAMISSALEPAGDYIIIKPAAAGSTYNPNIEEVPHSLGLFVMSQCPYGSTAVKNTKEVVDNLKGLNFTLWFIADLGSDGTFSSLHGPTEVAEDLRQVCAASHYPTKYYSYVYCMAENYKTAADSWEGCADTAGIDKAVIKACSEGSEGTALLKENIKKSQEYGIGSSPTFLVNNKYQFTGALPAQTIKTNYCKYNEQDAGCDKQLNATGSTTTSGSCS